MTVSWTRHRFSGGTLALDTANTVVHRGDATRSFDRFEDPREIARFAAAAQGFRAAEIGDRRLCVIDASVIRETVLAIRETTDALFRGSASGGELDPVALPPFLRACADGLDAASQSGPGRHEALAVAFEAALAMSALALLSEQNYRRIRICPNCNWLFLDRSRNASRLWCDMTVCGNRQKAKRHYRRRKATEEDFSNA